jgi:N-sulfoglucosamine sulfohydrolase
MFASRTLAILIGAILFALAQPASAAEPARPNILFAIADDWGFGHAGAYGCKWVNVPAFDRLAKEGVLFNNCFTSNPKCSPCRASILTGRNSWQTEEACCHFGLFRAKWAVYPDVLEKEGYQVGFTGKGWGPGDWATGGFKRNPAGPEFSRLKAKPPTTGISPVDYASNFDAFLAKRMPGQPFCFWFGCHEPHRAYEEGSGVRSGKKLSDVTLPAYYPNSPTIRSDFLDYAVEVEWFDAHLGKMLKKLEDLGELDNTIVVMTSDHGEPFPRAKGQIYERGYHIPLAIRWGKVAKGGRVVDDFINVRDFAPTFLEAAGVAIPETVTGKSFVDVLKSSKSNWVDSTRNRMLIGKERHDVGRPNDLGYPVRAIRTPEYLYAKNYEPTRWPVGNPETGYRNCDDGPTKSFILADFNRFYNLCFGFRPTEELYRVDKDPDCVVNLAADTSLAAVKEELRKEMEDLLRKDKDPRILGNGAVFDTYKYVGPARHNYDLWLKNQ